MSRMVQMDVGAKNLVNFDAAKRDRLDKAYRAAANRKAATFLFEGQEYVTGYAKYLLEYLKGVIR